MADLKSTFLGIITRIFHKHCHLFCRLCTWLNGIICQKCQREVVKFARVYQSRLLYCLLLRGAPFASIRRHSPQNNNIYNVFWQSGSHFGLAAPFPFLWNNSARKSHAAQQTLKFRSVRSEVFVDPVPKITLVRSLKINIGRRRKMQAVPKMITYLYKVVCFFFLQENFHSVFGDLYFAALNKLVYLMEWQYCNRKW